VISAADEIMIELFSGLSARQFAKLVRQLRSEGADPVLKGLGNSPSKTGSCWSRPIGGRT
jgi:hypothetical protein